MEASLSVDYTLMVDVVIEFFNISASSLESGSFND